MDEDKLIGFFNRGFREVVLPSIEKLEEEINQRFDRVDSRLDRIERRLDYLQDKDLDLEKRIVGLETSVHH